MKKKDRILGIMVLAVAAGLLVHLVLQPAALSHYHSPDPDLQPNPLVIGGASASLLDFGPESRSTTWPPVISPLSLPSVPPQDFNSIDGVIGLGDIPTLEATPAERLAFSRDRGELKITRILD